MMSKFRPQELRKSHSYVRCLQRGWEHRRFKALILMLRRSVTAYAIIGDSIHAGLLPEDHHTREVRRGRHVEQQRDRQKEIRSGGQERLPGQGGCVFRRRARQRPADNSLIIRPDDCPIR